MADISLQPQDYRLTTAEILYGMPDFPDLLQTYVWQGLDRVPDFPRLNGFLAFWESEVEGRLHSVRVAFVDEIQPGGWRSLRASMSIH